MLIPLKYTYLIGSIISLIPWTIIFLYRKGLRKEMLTMSILFSIGGLITEYYFWTIDWWHPLTITGTKIGIEDFLLGFSTGGIAAVVYEVVFRKNPYKYEKFHNLGMFAIITLNFIITISLFHVWKFTSFTATIVALATTSVILLLIRKDLLYDAFVTGLSLILVALSIFTVLQIISPKFIPEFWYWGYLSKVKFLGAPIEDLVFFFLVGVFVAPFYLYWTGEKLRSLPITKPSKKRKKR